MRRFRFYCEKIEPQCVLNEEESHHLSRVLRIDTGSQVEVIDGKGGLGTGKVGKIERRQVTIEIDDIKRLAPAESGRLILAISYARGQRFDWCVEKCTELGACHIAAIQFERTVKLACGHAIERLEKISLSASKQCGRLFLPHITGPDRLEPGLKRLIEQYPNSVRLCGDASGKPVALHKWSKNQDVLFLVGPEGGFSPEETQFLTHLDFQFACINSNILRVETAAVAFAAFFNACSL
ncbi:MAG: 16S rRNA (uracil(1498)-N(3))-methyltransferase [Planctomycetaceae bacterium]|nr:16S rRNA (uracil(1498)-N(3))-methyltransferase [Planctomycetaceae bacterium]